MDNIGHSFGYHGSDADRCIYCHTYVDDGGPCIPQMKIREKEVKQQKEFLQKLLSIYKKLSKKERKTMRELFENAKIELKAIKGAHNATMSVFRDSGTGYLRSI